MKLNKKQYTKIANEMLKLLEDKDNMILFRIDRKSYDWEGIVSPTTRNVIMRYGKEYLLWYLSFPFKEGERLYFLPRRDKYKYLFMKRSDFKKKLLMTQGDIKKSLAILKNLK